MFNESDKYKHFHLVDSNDILAYIGLLHLCGALNVNLQNTRDLWFPESSNNLLPETMSWNWFHFISKFITFDNKATRDNCWKYDKYACIREMQNVLTLLLFLPLTKPYTHTEATSDSNNIMQISWQNMGCFTIAYVMHLFRIPIIHCPMLESLKIFLVMHQNITSQEPISTWST